MNCAASAPSLTRWSTEMVAFTQSGSASFFLGASLRRDRLPLGYLAYGDASAPVASVYRWADANHDGAVQASEEGTLVALAGPGSRAGNAHVHEDRVGRGAHLQRRTGRLHVSVVDIRGQGVCQQVHANAGPDRNLRPARPAASAVDHSASPGRSARRLRATRPWSRASSPSTVSPCGRS